MSGKLIVFEGTDGSGKATQAKLLCETLAQRGIAYREIDFPRYGNPFAEPANLYLHGALGNRPGDVNAYAASVLYAVDRFASYKEDWGGFYEEGGIVVANATISLQHPRKTNRKCCLCSVILILIRFLQTGILDGNGQQLNIRK